MQSVDDAVEVLTRLIAAIDRGELTSSAEARDALAGALIALTSVRDTDV